MVKKINTAVLTIRFSSAFHKYKLIIQIFFVCSVHFLTKKCFHLFSNSDMKKWQNITYNTHRKFMHYNHNFQTSIWIFFIAHFMIISLSNHFFTLKYNVKYKFLVDPVFSQVIFIKNGCVDWLILFIKGATVLSHSVFDCKQSAWNLKEVPKKYTVIRSLIQYGRYDTIYSLVHEQYNPNWTLGFKKLWKNGAPVAIQIACTFSEYKTTMDVHRICLANILRI